MKKSSLEKPSIILASSSKQRKKSLKNLGLFFKTHLPLFNEEEKKKEFFQYFKDKHFKNKNFLFYKLCQKLAYEKAKSLNSKFEGSIIIGGDQIVRYKNQYLDKPLTEKKARHQLQLLSSQTHELITSVCIVYRQKKFSHTEKAFLSMQKLSKREIANYVQKDQPLDCCGSYKLEKSGLLLFKKIKCNDFSSLFGLPVLAVIKILRKLKAISISSS